MALSGGGVLHAASGPLAPTAAATRLLISWLTWSLLPMALAEQGLPYVPTTILVPKADADPLQQNGTANIAYILGPHDNKAQLLALDISSSARSSALSLSVLSSELPFLEGRNTGFSASLADNGSIIVFAGDCSSAGGSDIWRLDPGASGNADIENTSWKKEDTSVDGKADTVQMGPGMLGSSFAFSSTLEPEMEKATIYIYGGMCPWANSTTSQENANYSNQMLRLAPPQDDETGCTLGPVESRGPPVAEAGFTFTGLSPSISNASGTVTQQVNYVLLGGHTQHAFVNMSTVALWSLPEESWAFVSDIPVTGGANPNTELAIKSASGGIDSRSGHTAVLSEDGASLVVLGGWVGDVSQAAEPQLAVLDIGQRYGGLGDWQWSIPSAQPSSPGIYGHGAALLPGNVMIVYGGYTIQPSGQARKRQDGSSGGDRPMFLNLTSWSWSDEYTNPSHDDASVSGAPPAAGMNEDQKKQLGLGLGIGLGLLAIIAAIALYFCYRRRLRGKRHVRDSQLQALAQDDSRFVHDDDQMMEHPGGSGAFPWYVGGPDPYGSGNRSLGFESLRAGRGSMDANRNMGFVPAPPGQVRRKPVMSRNSRGQYQPAATGVYDPPSTSRGPRAIHPIYEADEDGQMQDGDLANEPMSPFRDGGTDNRRYSDPFLTPTHERTISFPPPSRASNSPSPERFYRTTDPEVQDWMTDIDAADALLSGRNAPHSAAAGHGRISPTRRRSGRSTRSIGIALGGDEDSRTGSNISESNRSNLGTSRSGSVRSAIRAGFGVAAAATAAAMAEGRGGTADSSNSSSAPSYNTARTSFYALQAEGPSLLLGRDGNGSPTKDAAEDDPLQPPGSPSKFKPRRGWLGSFKRVFSGPTPSPSPPGSYNDGNSPARDSFAAASDYDPRLGGLGGIAAGGLLRRKGGRGAWDEVGSGSGDIASFRDRAGGPTRPGQGDDDEWDIEKAIEQRLVQVMFTVPKERLRVVNAEPEIDDALSGVLVNPEDDAQSERQVLHDAQQVGARDAQPSPLSEEDHLPDQSVTVVSTEDVEREALRMELDREYALEKGKGQQHQQQRDEEEKRRAELKREDERLADLEREIDLPGKELDAQRETQPSRVSDAHSDGAVFSAEAVKMERPRTRVLEMVESIESLKRDDEYQQIHSPGSSPGRSAPKLSPKR